MRSRCNNHRNADFRYYGGRGISYDPRWESFAVFLADMGERTAGLTLDRIDPNGHYSKSNCRWISQAAQVLTRRNIVRYSMNGESKTLPEWARETGVHAVTMRRRIEAGVPIETALTVRGLSKRVKTGAVA